MIKKILHIVVSLGSIFCLGYRVEAQQLPYNNTMQSNLDGVFTLMTGSEAVSYTSSGALVQPPRANSKVGLYMDGLSLASDRGFIVSFDYWMPGSTLEVPGFAFVLLDAQGDTPKLVSAGNSFSYHYVTSANGKFAAQLGPGITKSYLGIGFSPTGKFKNATLPEPFTNGIPVKMGINDFYDDKDHITIRAQGSGNVGYPVLYSKSTAKFKSNFSLNKVTGNYDKFTNTTSDPSFEIKRRSEENNDKKPQLGSERYRRVTITLLPGSKVGGITSGAYITVEVLQGINRIKVKVIDNYFVPNNEVIKYNDYTNLGKPVLKDMTLTLPQFLNFGFVTSQDYTMESPHNVISNLSVSLPFAPLLKGIVIEDACRDRSLEIDVLAGAKGFNNTTYDGSGNIGAGTDRSYIDPYSFRFKVSVDGQLEDSPEPYKVSTTKGVYLYEPETAKITFIPNKNIELGEDEVFYTVKNKATNGAINMGVEDFRSTTESVHINFSVLCQKTLMINGNTL